MGGHLPGKGFEWSVGPTRASLRMDLTSAAHVHPLLDTGYRRTTNGASRWACKNACQSQQQHARGQPTLPLFDPILTNEAEWRRRSPKLISDKVPVHKLSHLEHRDNLL